METWNTIGKCIRRKGEYTRIRAISCAVLAMLVAGAAVAHEQSLHKGHATEGRVTSISGDHLLLETEKGSVSVTIVETTKIERGDEAIAGSGIQAGDHASVFGTKLATGELVAKEIVVHGDGHGEDAAEGTNGHGQ